ncbi:MAG: DinB family protein, partial [Candidatus Bipolaricaulia bacterium]
MSTDEQRELKPHLVKLLRGGNAHVGFDGAVRDIDSELAGKGTAQLARTPWQVVEHMRICQRDILDYLTADRYDEPAFP